MKRFIWTTALFAALLYGAGTVEAVPPEQGSVEFDWDSFVYDCGDGFHIWEAGILQVNWKLFFDQDGNVTKEVEKYKFDGFVYENGNPDNYVDYTPLSYTITFKDGNAVVTGLLAHITIPGYGQIFRDVGRIGFIGEFEEIVFEAGEHEYWNAEWEEVCDYLANGD